jgi:hypothetical protein
MRLIDDPIQGRRKSLIQLFDALITQLRCKHQNRYSRSKPGTLLGKIGRKRNPKP